MSPLERLAYAVYVAFDVANNPELLEQWRAARIVYVERKKHRYVLCINNEDAATIPYAHPALELCWVPDPGSHDFTDNIWRSQLDKVTT